MSKVRQLIENVKELNNLIDDKVESTAKDVHEANQYLKNGQKTPMKKSKQIVKPENGEIDLAEGAPIGSFEYIRQEINEALNEAKLFDGKYCYLMYVYPESIIVSCDDDYFQIPYSMDINSDVSFGDEVQVDQIFTPSVNDNDVSENRFKNKRVKESSIKTLATELKESKIEITKKATQVDCCFDDFHSLKEVNYDDKTGELEVVLIEAGTNEVKMRHYPVSTIQEAAPLFKGLKMYINHQTAAEEKERPERDVRDWASTIMESWAEGGKAMGRVSIHDAWLRESMKDPVFRGNIGLSINAGGKISYGKINGKEMQIVEKIIPSRSNGPASVDWVTEAGARGRVSRLLKESQTKKENSMELKEATFEDLQRENPSLVKAISESVVKTIKESSEQKAKDAELKEKNDKLAAFELKEKQSVQSAKIDTWMKENAKLPEAVKIRVKKNLMSSLIESETELKEAFTSAVKEELAYLNTITGKGKIVLNEGVADKTNSGKSNFADAESRLSGRMGIVEKKKEEDSE